eukprot:2143695-Rhodomonas_salina.1
MNPEQESGCGGISTAHDELTKLWVVQVGDAAGWDWSSSVSPGYQLWTPNHLVSDGSAMRCQQMAAHHPT